MSELLLVEQHGSTTTYILAVQTWPSSILILPLLSSLTATADLYMAALRGARSS
jgi:hypothetical protein